MLISVLDLAVGRAQTYVYMEYKYISMAQGVFPRAGAAVKGWDLTLGCRHRLSELNHACKAKGPV